jgi:SAM-dependent methyltransferase
MTKITKCRMCSSKNLKKFLDLGSSPPSDDFLEKGQLEESEIFYPLNVLTCKECGLCQLGYVVPKEKMYNNNYPYESSITKTGKKHFTSMGKNLVDRFKLTKKDLVIDIGSNVGVLLNGFKLKKVKVLGIEPSTNIAKKARKNKINTISEFFSSTLAKKIVRKYGKASIITGTNVFAHIDKLDDFMKAVKILLKKDGVLVIEAPYLVNMLENLEYDTIYHEHLSYLSLKPMINFFKKFDMDVFDVEYYVIHGGTLRYFISHKKQNQISSNVKNMVSKEIQKKIYTDAYLKKFAEKVENHRDLLRKTLNGILNKNKKIIAISAPAKGNTLLNYCKLGIETISYVTEKSKLKIGKYTPGMHIPVYSDKKIASDKPDYALILAWNFAKEIMNNNNEFRKKGGKFIVPIPHPKIV